MTRLVVQLQSHDDPIRRAPRVGEHSVEILGALGYADADIATLLESGCVSAAGIAGEGTI